jgi:predicted unusual protein kinase regulating ubiquinone biosynthesis (AarF/ABC1/UbiB family)
MSSAAKKNLAAVLLILLTVAGLISLYQVAFDVWMTAYPYANADIWKQRLWVRLITTVVIAVLWVVTLTWLLRARRRGHSGTANGQHA